MSGLLTWLYYHLVRPYVVADIAIAQVIYGRASSIPEEHVVYVVHLEGGRVTPEKHMATAAPKGLN